MSHPTPTLSRMPDELYHPWRTLRADWAHVTVKHVVDLPPGTMGVTDGSHSIKLRDRMLQVERRCTLTHELIHLERGDTATCSPAAERDVDREAARRLIPLPALQAAARWTLQIEELADELWVTEDLVRARFETMTAPELLELAAVVQDAHTPPA